jgi:hypothetical protein
MARRSAVESLLSPGFISGLGLGLGLSVLYVKYLQTAGQEAPHPEPSDSDSAGQDMVGGYVML